jgi:hypothetical protein
MVVVPDRYAIVREDINYPLSVVGGAYEPFQNSDLFDFIGRFCRDTGSSIETAGSLRNGRTVWALAKNKVTEYLASDPIEKYFLIKNTNGEPQYPSCLISLPPPIWSASAS